MRKLFLLLCVMIILVLLAGCSGITKEAFGIEYIGEKICVGETISADEARNIMDSFSEVFPDGRENFIVNGDKVGRVSLSNGEAKSLCGIQIGDPAEDIVEVLGKNKMYDDIRDQSEYHVDYDYYVDFYGRLCGIADKINLNHMMELKLDTDEVAFYHTIQYYWSEESYGITFHVEDNKVAAITFRYYGS